MCLLLNLVKVCFDPMMPSCLRQYHCITESIEKNENQYHIYYSGMKKHPCQYDNLDLNVSVSGDVIFETNLIIEIASFSRQRCT